MLKAERRSEILRLLDERNFMTVSDVADAMGVSSMTIRRDVNELGEENQLIRLYGGIQKIDIKEKELTTSEKINLHKDRKEFIGKVMNSLIKDGDVVYVGAGTTILYALPFITKKELFVVTNSLIAFNYLVQNTDYKLLLTGGDYAPVTEEFIGEHAEKAFDTLNLDIAFAATNGIYNNNLTTSNLLQGSIQKAAFAHAKVKVAVADSTKFNVSDVYTLYHLSDLDYVITDDKIDSETFDYYSQYVPLLNKKYH